MLDFFARSLAAAITAAVLLFIAFYVAPCSATPAPAATLTRAS